MALREISLDPIHLSIRVAAAVRQFLDYGVKDLTTYIQTDKLCIENTFNVC